MQRGIIANSAKMQRLNPKGVSISGTISAVDMNYFLLYWDKIIMPTNNLIHIRVPNEDEVVKTGFLERPRVQFNSWSSNTDDGSYDPFVISQSIVANEILASDKSNDWTLHQIGEEIIIANEQRKKFKSIRVELYNCLPVPTKETSIAQILAFKEKRKDEFLALHSAIDGLYFDILKSPDIELQEKKSVAELEKAIKELGKTSLESFKLLSNYNFSVELNLSGKDFGLALAGGALFDYFTSGMSIPIATVFSGIISIINIKAHRTTSVEKSENKLKLNFLANANKKGIIKTISK